MHRTGRRPAARVLSWAGALTLGATAVAGCTPGGQEPSPEENGSSPEAAAGTGIPQVDREGYGPLTVYLVTPVWSAPPGTSGIRVGCQDQDLLVPVETVPTTSEDPADMAMDFLLQDVSGSHGDPALTNAVAASTKTLTYTGHHRDGDTEVFEFTGTVTVEDVCEAARVRAQLEATAAAHTDADQVRVTVDGEDIAHVLQLPEYEPGDEYTAPPAAEDAPQSPAPGEGGDVGDSGAPDAPGTPGTPEVPGAPGASGAPGEDVPSVPGSVPSYGVETQPVLPPDAP